MPTQIRSAVDVIRHDNHIPPALLTQRLFVLNSWTNTMVLSNVSTATNVKISFDGTNTFTIKPGGVFSLNFSNQTGYWTQGDGVGAVEVVYGSER